MNTKRNDLLAIVGAGEAAMPIINKAKELGIKTLAFGRLDSFAQHYVDFFIEENSFDVDFMASVAKEYGVTGVIASSEISTEATAKLANRLQLPGNSIEGGFAGKNKYMMRKRVQNLSSVKQPKFEIYSPSKQYDFPVIVKAVDSCGKKGVSLAKNAEEFNQALANAKESSSDKHSVLIEEYLCGGQEYSIECISYLHKHIIVQYTEKDSSGPPHFVECGHHQPANISDEIKGKIQIAVNDILEELGLNCGMAHMELKVIDGDVYFIEVGARAGGDHIADTLTLLSTDYDYFKAAIECSLGIFKPSDIHNRAYSGIYFHNSFNEKLKELFEKAKTADWCYKYNVENEQFSKASSNVESANSGYIIYCSDHKIIERDI